MDADGLQKALLDQEKPFHLGLISQESLEDGLLRKPARERSIAGRFTHTIGSVNEYYYVGGPRQARPPEGAFSKGTKVRLVRDAGSYSLIQSETGITAYVTTGCLKKID